MTRNRVIRMRRMLLVGGFILAIHASTADARPVFIDQNGAKIEPNRIELVAGAGFEVVLKQMKHWRGWGTDDRARARGVYRYRNCTPDCATGGYDTTSAKVRIRRRVPACGRNAVYRRIIINPKKRGFMTLKLEVGCDGYAKAGQFRAASSTPGA